MPNLYGLDSGAFDIGNDDTAAQQHASARAQHLIHLFNFIFTLVPANPEEFRSGRFKHPCIIAVTRKFFFEKRQSLGLKYPDEFKPLPLLTIAFVCTVVTLSFFFCDSTLLTYSK